MPALNRQFIYSAVERFDPACGQRWQDFIKWSGLTHLREVVSLDTILCPTIFEELSDEDWQHNVHEDYKLHLFRDLEYVLDRVAGNGRAAVLTLMRNPTYEELRSFSDDRFVFRGFDFMDLQGGNSALVNCGGFPDAFSSAELSDCGLLSEHAKALQIQKTLRTEHPGEFDADCDVWAIWQWKVNLRYVE